MKVYEGSCRALRPLQVYPKLYTHRDLLFRYKFVWCLGVSADLLRLIRRGVAHPPNRLQEGQHAYSFAVSIRDLSSDETSLRILAWCSCCLPASIWAVGVLPAVVYSTLAPCCQLPAAVMLK